MTSRSHDTCAPFDARPLQHLSDEVLEERIAALAGQLAATEATFLAHVIEMDMRGMWGDAGMKSGAAWLSWRLGVRPGTAREHLRVGYALLDLPKVATAFAEGRLSYCKVRALTRVATPSTEEELLEIALGCTGAQLERTVRAYRSVLTAETSASATLTRSLRRREHDDGSVTFTLRVPADEAPVVDKALDLAMRVVLDDDNRPIEVPEETTLAHELTDESPVARAGADAFVLLAESYVASGPVGERGDGLEVLVHTDLDALEGLAETSRDDGSGGEGGTSTAGASPSITVRSANGRPLLAETALRRICESAVRVMAHAPDGRPVDLGRAVRHATLKQRRLLRERDTCCRFPGCGQGRRLIPHHVTWWSRGGPTDLDNLVLICPAHHRAVHEVGYGVTALGAGQFRFTTPQGHELQETGTMEAPPTEPVPWVPRPMPTWGGEPLDLRLLIDSVVANTLIRAGHRLPDVPVDQIPRRLREATGWPLVPGWPRSEESMTAAA